MFYLFVMGNELHSRLYRGPHQEKLRIKPKKAELGLPKSLRWLPFAMPHGQHLNKVQTIDDPIIDDEGRNWHGMHSFRRLLPVFVNLIAMREDLQGIDGSHEFAGNGRRILRRVLFDERADGGQIARCPRHNSDVVMFGHLKWNYLRSMKRARRFSRTSSHAWPSPRSAWARPSSIAARVAESSSSKPSPRVW